jgi:hypothetical protein
MRFEPLEGGTQATMSGQAELGGFFGLGEGLIKKQMEGEFATNLEILKLLLEEGSE